MANPQTNADRYVASSYRKSVEDAGRSWAEEIKRLLGTTHTATAQVEPAAKGITSDRRIYSREYNAMSTRLQRRVGGFDNYFHKRRIGLIDSDGRATQKTTAGQARA